MRLIPPSPAPSTRSSGERIVFDLLKQTEMPGWTGLHSLSVSDHEYKRWGELDFVLLSAECLLVLEVKGGRVSAHEGVWTFTDRHGGEHESYESPFRQAESGLMGLKHRLEEHVHPDQLRGLSLGYGVVFPQTDFDVASVEWAPEAVLDRRQMGSAKQLAIWIRHLAEYWRRHTRTAEPAPESLVQNVLDLLRPEFDRVPSLAYRTSELLTLMERLTEEQYRQLDFVEENPRLLCEGGAGTGKTFLAAELARREVSRGRRVLLTCWSPVLAGFLRSRVPNDVRVRAFEELRSPHDEDVDVLIVDEAQDLMSAADLQVLDAQLVGGLENGRWAFFLDQNLQSAIRGRMDPDSLALLREFGGVPGHLHWNCRNTEPIMVQTRLMTGADLGNPTAGAGPPVKYVYYVNHDECARMLEQHLSDLIAGDVAPGDITILSPVPLIESSANKLTAKWRRSMIELDPRVAQEFPLPSMTFSRIADFKGLENRFIAVIDLDAFDASVGDLANIYVAMSRARAGLWIALHESLREPLARASRGNLELVVGS